MHLLAEGNILTMFRFSEFISPTPVDKRMFQLVMQDEARHVSYGMQHLKWILDNTPERQASSSTRRSTRPRTSASASSIRRSSRR